MQRLQTTVTFSSSAEEISHSSDEASGGGSANTDDKTNTRIKTHTKSSSDGQPLVSVVKSHRRNGSLRQRFESAEQLVQKFVTEAEAVAEHAVIKLCSDAWHVCHFNALPKWLQDNDFLHKGHRPPLPSFRQCFKSVFRLHTETGNIWTHGLGAALFVLLFAYSMVTFDYRERSFVDGLMLGIYFCGAITCLSFSTIFHTCSCHSREVSKFCSKLDYCGISIQIIGSMIPALYYGFYDNQIMYLTYITVGVVLCIISIVISMWDKFSEPKFRPLRVGVFLVFGLSNVVPGIHWAIVLESHLIGSFLLFILQGMLYVIGAALYAIRIPERFFPGKCDYWFQSHQIFHILVVTAAIVHLNGINGMAALRLSETQLQPVVEVQ
ncbi:unnamed protein product [Medioppia subpectinata]|uniref:Adiponectin receptor n=1 Tax=Medioppia subpectinata TaxID=1979941 RepID=A0A7R9PW23_9ACAR|nr:unnamed protein product [Medioppia subpectinata]CAG2103473.1 unnamed protein product [Medioppia subpectinata]